MSNGYWIQTYSGKAVDLIDPQPDQIDLLDIVVHLSRMPRYGGHCKATGYTNAQHSVYVANVCPDEFKLDGLLHDAAEFATGDITSPVKNLIKEMAGLEWNDFMYNMEKVVAVKFGCEYPLPGEVHYADLVVTATEKRDLMEKEPKPWVELPDPLPTHIMPWGEVLAFETFMLMYDKYKKV